MCICVYMHTHIDPLFWRGGRCNYVPKELSQPVTDGYMKGWFPLLMAANNRDIGNYCACILETLIGLGADPEATHGGCNALFKAVSTGHTDGMYALLASDRFNPQELFRGETNKENINTTQHVSNPNVTYLYIPISRLEAAPAESL